MTVMTRETWRKSQKQHVKRAVSDLSNKEQQISEQRLQRIQVDTKIGIYLTATIRTILLAGRCTSREQQKSYIKASGETKKCQQQHNKARRK